MLHSVSAIAERLSFWHIIRPMVLYMWRFVRQKPVDRSIAARYGMAPRT